MDLPSTVGVGLDVSVHQGGAFPASQDLFEVMAMQVRDRHLSSVGQVGQVVAQYLDGYLERTRLASSRVNDVVSHQAARFDSPPVASGQESDRRVMTALDALNRMFDYSIETQVVVRSATQVSGAVNTLMRGQ